MAGVGHSSKKGLYSLKCVVDISIFTAVEDLQFTLYCLITERKARDFIDFEVYGFGDLEIVPFLKEARDISYLSCPDRFWGPASLFSTVSGVKRSRRKADHSPPSNTKVKNSWNYTFYSSIRPNSSQISKETT
jgi:hypothetical protein